MSGKREQRLKARKTRTFRKRLAAVIAIVLIIVGAVVAYRLNSGNSPNTTPVKVLLVTSMGNITIELYDDMPITAGNFRNLVSNGVYNGTIFHRVVKDFVIQGGDPSTAGNNETIPTIHDEYSANASHNENDRGTVAMAKLGQSNSALPQPNSASSQFYINLKYNSNLDNNYSVFGKVVSGMDVVDAIGNVATDSNDKPLQPVTIISAQIVA